MRFWFYLAGHLGMTVAELQDRMTADEFTAWQVYFGMEPFGELRADWRSAMQAHATAQFGFRKPRGNIEPADFLLKFKQPGPRDGKDIMRSLFAAFPGGIVNKGTP